MKKGLPPLPLPKNYSAITSHKKQDHSSYFESLQQKLLSESEKVTTLMGKPNSGSDTRSQHASQKRPIPTQVDLYSSYPPKEENNMEEKQKQVSNSSIMLQKYLQVKKNQLASSRSQYFPPPKQKQQQIQRKLTYNLVRLPDQANSEHSFVNAHQRSPSKSDKINDHLKKTSSTVSSAALKTIDRIKKMHSLGDRPSYSSPTVPRIKGPCIQDFQILKYLQQGQFGTVYLAVHRRINFICALKKIPKKIFHGEQRFINQLVRQIKIQSFLDHPNIVQLYTFFSDDQNLYLILQPCCGGNVYTSLRKQGRFTEQRVKKMVKQVCDAIEFMHDSDIIHRDIKPQNILLHQVLYKIIKGIVKVCDFGWSIHSPLLRDTRCGTPLYSSPEVIQKQQYDNKVDIWNIGIFSFELLYGRVPFEIRTQDDLVKVVDDDIYFPKTVLLSKQAKSFILQCLHKNPKDRISMPRLVDHNFISE